LQLVKEMSLRICRKDSMADNDWFNYWFIKLVGSIDEFEFLQESAHDEFDKNPPFCVNYGDYYDIVRDNDEDELEKYSFYEKKEEKNVCFGFFSLFDFFDYF